MKMIKTFGDPSLPAIFLIHGGGLSWWMWQTHIDLLQPHFYVLVPVLSGHGENNKEDFISISESANQIISFINNNLNGNVNTLVGLSVGAQIICDMLAKQPNITQNAIIESALVKRMPLMTQLGAPIVTLTYPLIKKKWFAKLQAKQLYIPNDMFTAYFEDSKKMSKQSLINLTKSNADFSINKTITQTASRIIILYGEREPHIMQTSARQLANSLPSAQLAKQQNMHHGEKCLTAPRAHAQLILDFIS